MGMGVVVMGVEREGRIAEDTPAPVGVSSAIRREWQKVAMGQPDSEADDADLHDISAILHGSKAITGKAVYSARNSDQTDVQKAEQKEREADEQEARELMHLAEWNGQMINMGGVEMTNEEAQKARQHLIDNEDYYARRAVAEGRIRDDEKEEYKRTTLRIKELEDKKGRGIATTAEQTESEDLKRSKLGRETEHDAAQARMEGKEYQEKSDATGERDNAAHRQVTPMLQDKDLFQSAPDLTKHHAQAMAALTPLDKTPDATVTPLSPKLAASGFGV